MTSVEPRQENAAVGRWAFTHLYRAATALLTLVLFGLAFFYRPDLLTWWLRTTMQGIEQASALLPYPWGDRVEVALRGFGGSFWFQVAIAILAVRTVLSLVAMGWRRRRRPRRGPLS